MSEVSIKVVVRVRPLLPKEKLNDERTCVSCNIDQRQIIVGRDRTFTFDNVFPPGTTQQEVYETCVSASIGSLFEGYNVTVFAYGQTGSGKTYTMGGYDLTTIAPDEYGIMPRAIGSIFSKLEQLSAENMASNSEENNADTQLATQRTFVQNSKYDYRVKVSYIEIYKEELKDLLDSEKSPKDMHIREDESGNTVLFGITEAECLTRDDVFSCLERGTLARHTGLTMMNEYSNRSHCLFTVTLEQYWLVGDEENVKVPEQSSVALPVSRSLVAKFHFVDLAGSERVTKTGNVGDRFKESVHINSGLLSLGNVISALSDPKRRNTHVPYRDSKITRLLKDSLGGNSNTVMICCVSPAESSMDESINSLKYASRAKFIKNHPVVNSKAVNARAKLTAQIQQLKAELEMERQRSQLTSALDKPNAPQSHISSLPTSQLRSLLEEARDLFTVFTKASDFLAVLNAHDERTRVDEWLEVCEMTLNDLPDKSGLQSRLDNSKVRRLEAELNETREQLTHDESIFAEKNVEITELQSRIDSLEKQLDYAARARDEMMKLLKERETRMVELQVRVDELNVQMHSLRSESAASDVMAKRKQTSAPQTQTQTQTQPTDPAAAAGNIERIMQHFRARVRLLELSQLPPGRQNQNETSLDSQRGEEQKVLVRDLLSADASKRLSNLKSSLETRGTFRIKAKNRKSVVIVAPDSDSRRDDDEEDQDDVQNRVEDAALVGLHQREGEQKLKDLNLNIRLKEQLIQELVRNCKQNETLNKQFAGKIRELEAEKTRAKAEVTELNTKMQSLLTDAQRRNKGTGQAEAAAAEDVQRIKVQYEARIHAATARILELQKRQLESRRFAEVNAEKVKKMQDLEVALSEMRQQRENLTRKLKEESDRKRKLETDIQREMQRVKELERKSENQERILKVRSGKDGRRSRKPTNEHENVSATLQRDETDLSTKTNEQLEQKRVWLDAEIEKVIEERTRIAEFERELQKREEILKKKELLVKERAQLEIKKMRASQAVNDDIARLSTRLENIDEKLAERSALLGDAKQSDNERRQRVDKAIAELQASKAKLEKQRVELETKLYGNDERGPSILSEAEERRLIEVEEAIDAMDSAIAYKSEIIDRKGIELEQQADALRTSLGGVHTRLLQIDEDEAKRLLMRYFDKVIALKEDSRRHDAVMKDYEFKIDEQATLIRQLESAIERQRTDFQKTLRQERPRTAVRDEPPVTQEPSSELKQKVLSLEKDLLYYKHSTRELRKKMRELLGGNQVGTSLVAASSNDVIAEAEDQQDGSPVSGRLTNRHAPLSSMPGHVLLPTQPKSPRSSQARAVRVSRKELRELSDSEIQQRLSRASTNLVNQNGLNVPVAASHSVSVTSASVAEPEVTQRGVLLQHQSVIRVIQSDSTQPADSIQIQRDSLDAGNQDDTKLTYDEADDDDD